MSTPSISLDGSIEQSYTDALDYIVRLESELAQAREQLRRADIRITYLELERVQRRALDANLHLSASQKSTFWAVRDIVLAVSPDAGFDRTEIHMRDVAQAAGLSENRTRDALHALDKAGVLEYSWEKERQGLDSKGRPVFRTHSYVALTLLADSPEFITIKRNHGGKRVKNCPHCGSENLYVERRTLCGCCKKELDYHLQPLGNDDGNYATTASEGGQDDGTAPF